jgi:hypothetical protein
MRDMSRNQKRIGMFAATLAAGLFSTAASAVLVINAGGTEIRTDTRSETAASVSNSAVFVDVAGANVVVVVPNGQRRLITARFAGESRCFGAAAAPQAWCSLQVIATTAAGGTIFFNPNSGVDFAFDTNPAGAADDLWESHAFERSVRLPPGTYRIRLQRRVTHNATSFWLDDWHFAVETNL